MGARFAPTLVSVFVTLSALAACKPTQDSAVKNDVAQVETENVTKSATKEVMGRLSISADKRVLLLAKVNPARPLIDIRFRVDGDTAINSLDLHLTKDANGNQRCESTSGGQACRYANELAQTELTIHFDRTTNDAKIVGAVWQGTPVPEAGIVTKNSEPGKGEVGCDLMTGVGCGT